MIVLKFFKNHPWMTAFAAYMTCALLIFHHLAKKFGRKLLWYERLLSLLLLLGIVCLFALAIQNEAFKTILEWIKSVLLNLLLILGSINISLARLLKDSPSKSSTIVDKSELPETGNDCKTFVLFSILTFVATRFLLILYKRRLVGESPFTGIVIEMVESYTLPGHQRKS